ncbi:MAG: GHKL domain-containing protein [Lachnospiraceae bacterium]|nr:GHKL domain-containing protein [Lachnospiraceae bacterium]MCI9371120.1 GHKL domain-containing protein [Lachnospiraceae bacterium]
MIKLTDRRISLYQSDLMEKHCQEVENMYRQTRGWRHDYHNHIQTMKAYLIMGNLDKLASYLNELDTDLTAVDTVIKTGNIMIDAVLNSKISLAKSRGITVDAKAIVPKNLSVSEIDLSLIIGNLMDNAMEACMKTEKNKRFIRVYIDILKGQLYIYVMNSTSGKLKKSGKLYLSTKNQKYHGFGLMRMDKVVDRYQGYVDRQDEEDVFVTEIMLPL